MDKPEALFLADELEAPLGTVIGAELDRRAAAELRRLHAENETLKQSVARLQQYHATAWNRGHTMGMKANEDTARRALDAVKQDAWGNTQLTEALLKAEAQRDALLAEHQQTLALQQRSYEREIRLEVEAEREACAKLCEDYDDDRGTGETWGPRFADLIRARGNT